MISYKKSPFIIVLKIALIGCFAYFHSNFSLEIPSFKEWKQRCDQIPHFKDALKTSGILHDYSKTATNHQEFMAAVDTFTNLLQNQLSTTQWVHNDGFWPSFLDNSSPTEFSPYVQALRVKPGTEIIMFGDRHGDVRSTVSMISELSHKGYFDTKNPFKLKPGTLLIGLGDYVDRGNAGVETFLTMLWLKICNPDQVILVRGNHEDSTYHVNQTQFQKELSIKLGPALSDADKQKVNHIYDLMPVALFIGSGNSRSTSFMVGCHGFIEPGYHPYNLLDMAVQQTENISCFEKITTLQRGAHLAQLSSDLTKSIQALQKKSAQFAMQLETHSVAKVPNSYLGWLWSYAIVDDGQKQFDFDEFTHTWQWGKQLTEEILSYWSKPGSYTISWIFRGHQHSHNQEYQMYPAIMHKLWANDGLYKLWSKSGDAHSMKDPGAYTLGVAPDNVYAGTIDQEIYPGFNYDTWVVVKTGTTKNDWQLTVHNKAMFPLEQTPLLVDGKIIVPQKLYEIPLEKRIKNRHNFYAIEPGKCYRTQLLAPHILEKYIKDNNIKTIINLRLADTQAPWYKNEIKLCQKYGVTFHTIGFEPTQLPTKKQLMKLLKIFHSTKDGAILIHCYAGADRTGLAAALWVTEKMNGTLWQALAQQTSFFHHDARMYPHLRKFTCWWHIMKKLYKNDICKILANYDSENTFKKQ